MAREEEYEDEDDYGSDGPSGKGLLTLVKLLFLPSFAIGFVVYNWLMLQKLRQRISVIVITAIIATIILIAGFLSVGGFGVYGEVFSDFSNIGENWTTLITPTILLVLILSAPFGLMMAGWNVWEMRQKPWRISQNTNWMYGFDYRRTPWEYFKRKERAERLKDGSLITSNFAPLGIEEKSPGIVETEDRVVGQFDDETIRHTLITGAPGSGKSITITSRIYADIKRRRSVVIIDFKRDPEFASKVATWAKEQKMGFYHFVSGTSEDYDIANSPGHAHYDPLASMSAQTIADTLLSMREYDTSADIYKNRDQQLYSILTGMLEYVVKTGRRSEIPKIDWNSGTFYMIASALKPENLTTLAQIATESPEIGSEVSDWLGSLSGRGSENAKTLEGFRGTLRTMTTSEYARWIKRGGETARNIDLYNLTSTGHNVIMFSLNSDSEKEFSGYMGSMIMSDITNTQAKRRNSGENNLVSIYVDEFQVLPAETVTGVLEKARASVMGITLAQQSLEQISASSDKGEVLLKSILDTCGNFVVHNGSVESSAERYSNIAGKRKFTKYMVSHHLKSFFGSFNFSARRHNDVRTTTEEDWIYPPQFFIDLMSPSKDNGYKSTAIVMNKQSFDPVFSGRSGATARKVWMIPNSRVLDTYYKGEKTRLKRGEAGFKPFTEEEQAGFAKIEENKAETKKAVEGRTKGFGTYKQGDANKTAQTVKPTQNAKSTQNANSAKTVSSGNSAKTGVDTSFSASATNSAPSHSPEGMVWASEGKVPTSEGKVPTTAENPEISRKTSGSSGPSDWDSLFETVKEAQNKHKREQGQKTAVSDPKNIGNSQKSDIGSFNGFSGFGKRG